MTAPQSKPTAVEGCQPNCGRRGGNCVCQQAAECIVEGVQSCQPEADALRQEVAVIHGVGEIVVELNDCGFESAIELIDTLTKQRDAAEYWVKELTRALRDVLDSEALETMEGCDCESCAPIARARSMVPLEQSGSGK